MASYSLSNGGVRRGAISATRFGSSIAASGSSYFSGSNGGVRRGAISATAATSAVKAEKKRKAGCCSSLHGGGVTGGGGGAQCGARGGLSLVQPQPLLAFTVLESPNRPLDEHSLQPYSCLIFSVQLLSSLPTSLCPLTLCVEIVFYEDIF